MTTARPVGSPISSTMGLRKRFAVIWAPAIDLRDAAEDHAAHNAVLDLTLVLTPFIADTGFRAAKQGLSDFGLSVNGSKSLRHTPSATPPPCDLAQEFLYTVTTASSRAAPPPTQVGSASFDTFLSSNRNTRWQPFTPQPSTFLPPGPLGSTSRQPPAPFLWFPESHAPPPPASTDPNTAVRSGHRTRQPPKLSNESSFPNRRWDATRCGNHQGRQSEAAVRHIADKRNRSQSPRPTSARTNTTSKASR